MSVAKVITIVSSSEQSFDDAVQEGLRTASKSLRGISGIKICDWTCDVDGDQISRYKVTLDVAFRLEDKQSAA